MDKWFDEYVKAVMDKQVVTNRIFKEEKRWWRFWVNSKKD
tara:strand:+ start:30273 stop:30392 length:120 start_codon:yes stop_codon:yes gene_type:complete